MSAAAETPVAPETAAAPPKRKKLGLIIGAAVLVLAGGGGAAYFFMNKSAPAAEDDSGHGGASEHGAAAEADGHGKAAGGAKGAAQYLPLQPAFVVNLNDPEAARYLQVDMEVMARDSKALDDVKNNMPRIRNSVLLLLGSRQASELATRADKEKLQADVAAEIQKVLNELPGKPKIETVYFNSFVMQ